MMKTKNGEFLDFLYQRIAKLEELIVERKGTVPLDLDKLIRYITLREKYEEGPK